MEEDFVRQADTGDLLLFRSKQFGGKVTRTITKSDFDHVGMILKFEDLENEIFMLDATYGNGVAIQRWSSLKRYLIGDNNP
jgi:hypothetical protein